MLQKQMSTKNESQWLDTQGLYGRKATSARDGTLEEGKCEILSLYVQSRLEASISCLFLRCSRKFVVTVEEFPSQTPNQKKIRFFILKPCLLLF
jgi:hypothetical protein